MFSTNMLAVFALSVILFLFVLIYYLDKKGMNWNLQFVIAMVAGLAVGFAFRDNKYFSNNLIYVSLIGDIYIGLTKAIVAPLIFLTIISSVTSLEGTSRLRQLGGKSIFWLIFQTFLAVVLAMAVCIPLKIGADAGALTSTYNPQTYANIGTQFTDVVRDFFPQNVFNELANNKVIPIIITALALSVAYMVIPDKKKIEPFRDVVLAAKELVFKIVGFIIDLIPYAILALAADMGGNIGSNWESARSLLSVIVLIIVLCLFQGFVISGLLIRFVAKLNPVRFFQKIPDVLVMGFTTQSTLASLPTIINALTRRIGVKEETANFTASLGSTMGMPGCAGIWPIVLSIFAINYVGIEYSVIQYITLGLIAVAVSFGTAGVSGTAIITATAVFTTAGLPLEVMVLLLPITFIVGCFRTIPNVICATSAATIVARRTGTLDDTIFNAVSGKEEYAAE